VHEFQIETRSLVFIFTVNEREEVVVAFLIVLTIVEKVQVLAWRVEIDGGQVVYGGVNGLG
jgi:hypothetical protein